MDEALPATTTAQENLVTARQSRINLIWEVTQSIISLTITLAAIYCTIAQIPGSIVNYAFFLIVGFYFSRTNHAAIGGIGLKPEVIYQGR
jgi:hypothetical protein